MKDISVHHFRRQAKSSARDCLGWTGKGEVKSNLFLTSVASPKALGCFVWIAADGEDLVVDHLHPVVGQWQMQLDVVKGLEPGVRQAVEHLLAVIKCEQPLEPLNIYRYNKLLILNQRSPDICVNPCSFHPCRPRSHPISIRASHKLPSHSYFPNILSEISEEKWKTYLINKPLWDRSVNGNTVSWISEH